MSQTVTLTWPADGVAVVTVDDRATPNHNITFATVGALADMLAKAREDGALVVVLASGHADAWPTDARQPPVRSGRPPCFAAPRHKCGISNP